MNNGSSPLSTKILGLRGVCTIPLYIPVNTYNTDTNVTIHIWIVSMLISFNWVGSNSSKGLISPKENLANRWPLTEFIKIQAQVVHCTIQIIGDEGHLTLRNTEES
jgi:hypothetical protein